MEYLLAPLEKLRLRQSHQLLESPPLTLGLIPFVCDPGFAEDIAKTQSLVDGEDEREEYAEAHGPLLIAACAFVAGPHHVSPRFENLHDTLSLDLEEREFDLPLYATCGRPFGKLLVETALYHDHGIFVEDEASFEDRGGYVDLKGLPKKFALEQSLLLSID